MKLPQKIQNRTVVGIEELKSMYHSYQQIHTELHNLHTNHKNVTQEMATTPSTEQLYKELSNKRTDIQNNTTLIDKEVVKLQSDIIKVYKNIYELPTMSFNCWSDRQAYSLALVLMRIGENIHINHGEEAGAVIKRTGERDYELYSIPIYWWEETLASIHSVYDEDDYITTKGKLITKVIAAFESWT